MVAAPIRSELRHKGTGREFRDLEMHLWTFRPDALSVVSAIWAIRASSPT